MCQRQQQIEGLANQPPDWCAKARQIKQGMMQQLLTGRIRLGKPSSEASDVATEQASVRKANVPFIRSVLAAEIIAGQKPHIDYNCIPWVIYTSPEIAWVGKTEAQLKAEGISYKSGQFPFAANGRALGMDRAEGFVKVLADAKTDEILGVHIISSAASDLIAEAAVAMEFKASSEDIGRICHPHPSMSEVMREAALAADKRALNM